MTLCWGPLLDGEAQDPTLRPSGPPARTFRVIRHLHREQFVAGDPARIWDFFATPRNLDTLTSPHLRFRMIGDIAPPAELMKTQTDRKIAAELERTYDAQRQAQVKRQSLERETSVANLQAFAREVLPHAPDAWIATDKTQIGYEISFARYFYKPAPLRTLAEIRADILALERQSEGLLHKIVGAA